MTSLKINHLPSQMFGWSSGLNALNKRGQSPAYLRRSISPDDVKVFDRRRRLSDQTSTVNKQNLHSRLHWLTLPEVTQPMQSTIDQEPVIPHRTRKIKIKDTLGLQKLKVSDLQMSGNKHSDTFICKEVKKSVNLPKDVRCGELVSFMTPDGKVVLGVPIKSRSMSPLKRRTSQSPLRRSTSPTTHRSTSPMKYRPMLRSTSPVLSRTMNNKVSGRMVCIKLPLPQGISADKINISMKDSELIMRCVDKAVTADTATRINVFNSVVLPKNTDWSKLKCVKQKDFVVITAPLLSMNDKNGMHHLTHDIGDINQIFTQEHKKKKKKKQQIHDIESLFFNGNVLPFLTPTGSSKKKGKGKVRNILNI